MSSTSGSSRCPRPRSPFDDRAARDLRRRRLRDRGDAPDPQRRRADSRQRCTRPHAHLAVVHRVRRQLRDDRDHVDQSPHDHEPDRARRSPLPDREHPPVDGHRVLPLHDPTRRGARPRRRHPRRRARLRLHRSLDRDHVQRDVVLRVPAQPAPPSGRRPRDRQGHHPHLHSGTLDLPRSDAGRLPEPGHEHRPLRCDRSLLPRRELAVRRVLVSRLSPMESSRPVAERPRRPEWMKVRAPSADSRYFDVKKLIHGASLHTICEEARCPNIGECWGRGTATFQILGDTCTRACRYCYVHSGKPEGPPDPLEPLRLAHVAAQMELKHVVVTSVDRDDVPDRGAGHYAATIRALKKKLPDASVEVLTPDFLDVEEKALQTVVGARPDVLNHNIETVRRLHPNMRGAKASYDKALWLLRRAKEIADYPVLTKSGIIVGLGETNDEVVETMRDLRANGVDVVTIGQYLQPSAKHAMIDRWVHPAEFRWFREQGEALGFGSVFAGPLVRSSYRADEQQRAAASGARAIAYQKQKGRPEAALLRDRSSTGLGAEES